MGNLLKIAMCGIGCVYLLMHVAYALTSAAESIKNRDRHADDTTPSARSRALDREAVAAHQDTVSLEQRTS
jgi:hypothetical protein